MWTEGGTASLSDTQRNPKTKAVAIHLNNSTNFILKPKNRFLLPLYKQTEHTGTRSNLNAIHQLIASLNANHSL